MKKNNLIVLIVSAVVIAILTVAVIYFVRKANQNEKEMAEVVEMMNFEKEQLQNEYSDLDIEFGGYTTTIKNDSIVQLLEDQKVKVQQLLDELRVTKSTNARRISQLKKELATVRGVMIMYITQIDSLNSLNKELKTENVAVKRQFQAASETVVQLSKDKENLHEVVTRAAMMEVTNFSAVTLNNKNRKTDRFSQIANIQLNYTIARNVTAQPGEKTMYVRITRPDDYVLTKSPGNVFPFEDKNIAYSARKDFEFEGEAIRDVIYWKVEEILQIGTYRVDYFVDGNRVGSFSFAIKK